MSWISDVRDEIQQLRSTRKELRRFGILVGTVCVALSGLGMYRSWWFSGACALLAAGIGLLSFGILFPDSLKKVYRGWMALAFAIGWLVSRLILIILFFAVLTPIGYLARLFGKEFISADFQKKKNWYWISRAAEKKINYEKLF